MIVNHDIATVKENWELMFCTWSQIRMERLFLQLLKKKLTSLNKFPHWKKHWTPPLFPPLKIHKLPPPPPITRSVCILLPPPSSPPPPPHLQRNYIWFSNIKKGRGIWCSNIRNHTAEKCLNNNLIKYFTKPHQHQIVKHLWDKKSRLLLRSLINYLFQQTFNLLTFFFFEKTLFYLLIISNISKILLLNFS